MHEIHIWLADEWIKWKESVHYEWKKNTTTLTYPLPYTPSFIFIKNISSLKMGQSKDVSIYFTLKLCPKQYEEQETKHQFHPPWETMQYLNPKTECEVRIWVGGLVKRFSSETGRQTQRRGGRGAKGTQWGTHITTHSAQLFPLRSRVYFIIPWTWGCLTTYCEEENVTEVMLLSFRLKLLETDAGAPTLTFLRTQCGKLAPARWEMKGHRHRDGPFQLRLLRPTLPKARHVREAS